MEELFFKLLNMSIQASLLVVVVALLRIVLMQSPKWIRLLLWGMVAVRLLCPFSFESNVSLAPASDVVDMDDFIVSPNIHIGDGLNSLPQNEKMVTGDAEGISTKSNISASEIIYGINTVDVITIVWVSGIIIMLGYALISSLRVYRRIQASVRIRDNIYVCDNIDSPFIFGIIRPGIYIPSTINNEQLSSVMAHEEAHIKRFDHLWKPFGYILLSVYWFSPFCWLAYILLCRDIELACDEKVIKDMDIEQKKVYSKVLLSFSEQRKYISVCPLAFGEIGVRERIKSVLNYKKPAFWVIVVAVIAVAVTSVLFLTSPKNSVARQDNQVEDAERKADYSEVASEAEKKVSAAKMAEEERLSAQKSDKGAEESKLAEEAARRAEEQNVKKSVEVKVPDLDLAESTGADGTTIYYADKDKFIFAGCYGLYVYDMNKNQVIRSVDLEPIGCNYTQGDSYCEINVTKDGKKVLLHPADKSDMYEYNVADNTLIMKPYSLEGYQLYEKKAIDELDYKGTISYEVDGQSGYIGLINDYTIGEIGYHTNPLLSSYTPIFNYTEENMGVEYEGKEGQYIVEGDMVLKYKKTLIGRSPNAACDTKYIVLTNNKKITFEQVDKSLYSSNMDDWLDDTIIIGVGTIE